MKRFISGFISTAVLASSILSMNTFASGRDVYCNVRNIHEPIVSDGIGTDCVRIDVMFEGFEKGISVLGVHVNLGEGIEPVLYEDGTPVYTFNTNARSSDSRKVNKVGYKNSVFFTMSTSEFPMDVKDSDSYDGCYFSLYAKKTSKYNGKNATATIDFWDSDKIAMNKYYYVGYGNTVDVSEMLSTGEYIVGDVDNNGLVDAVDASNLWAGLEKSKQNELFVRSINHNFTNWFPDSICASSPDADENMIINNDDALAIMHYYADISSGLDGYLNIGKIEVYENFNN